MMSDDPARVGRTYEIDEARSLTVSLTHEGVIIDAYDGNDHVGTMAAMAEEWFEYIAD